MKARFLLAALAALAALAGCRASDEAALFERRAARETGIAFANLLTEDDSVYNPLSFDYLYNGAGVAAGDFNNDGLLDLFFAGNMVSSRLYLNRGELRFEDVTAAAGTGTRAWATGVALVDINQDGRLDVYVSVAGKVPEAERGNLLFVNQGSDLNGTPRFVEQAREYGIADTGYSTQAAFFDYDRDGDLDLYVLTNALEEYNRNILRPRATDGSGASTDRLYRNNGDGTFTNVSREAGITIEGYGLGVVVSDLNQDGWPDVYAANDFQSNDLVWINNRDGTFTNQAARYLKHQTHNGMGTDAADYDNDGRPDIVVVDMLPHGNERQKMMLPGGNYDKFHMALNLGYQPQYMRNTLQLNTGPAPDGEPRFSEVGQLAGIHDTDWSWAPLFADFDNDGLKDLFISNGYRRDVTNLDFIVYSQEGAKLEAPEVRRRKLFEKMRELPEVKIPSYLFRNNGDLTFTDKSEEWGVAVPSFSNGAAYADLDNDGDLDLVVNNLDEPAFLFENRSDRLAGRHWLRVGLRGPRGNAQGLGARVTVHAGGRRQYQEQSPYRGYKSTVDPLLHFGLGAAARIDSLEVVWPDGKRQTLRGVATDRVVRLNHADAAPPPPAAPAPRPAYLFHPVPAAETPGLSYRHVERPVADFKFTPLLPHQHSKGGPGIATGDVDGNGLDDVYLGSDRGQPKEILLQTAPGRFARRPLAGMTEYEDMGALFFDADGDGDTDLYVVSGGSFGYSDPRLYQDRLYVNDGRGALTPDPAALPVDTASGSSVVAADYDRDGDLDLFVGGRIVPTRYPHPARSSLLRNDSRPGGPPRFTDVTRLVAPGLEEVGLVSAALWTDWDQDGRVDLLLAGEWMPLTFFRNTGGKLADATAATGLGKTNGWWNSLASGDFDNDGDLDYVAGNRGLNARYPASPRQPVRLHAADFDKNGSVDPILSYYIDGESYPAASRDMLIDQIVAMKGRFPRYEDYAKATLEKTLSREEREAAYVAESVNFASSYLENRGGGRFALRPLPIPAQLSPAFGLLVDDANADGNLDVLLVGNSYATETQTGWYDASIGSVLLGDGRGRFRHLTGSQSGLFVEGDARAIAEVRVDDRHSLLLVTQNSDSLRVFSPATDGECSLVRLQPRDAYAVLSLPGGRTRRQELPYGSSYLSQSSRVLKLPPGVERAVVYDSQGRSREVRP